MGERVVINGQLGLGTALIVAFVFGGIATFGTMVLYVAAQEAVFDWIFAAIAAVVVILFWAVIGVLWSALGVWMIITRDGMRTVGAFGSRSYPANGLKAGLFRTSKSRSKPGSPGHKRIVVDQLWVRKAGGKPRMISESRPDGPVHGRIVTVFKDLMGVSVVRLERDTTRMIIAPDFSVFDKGA